MLRAVASLAAVAALAAAQAGPSPSPTPAFLPAEPGWWSAEPARAGVPGRSVDAASCTAACLAEAGCAQAIDYGELTSTETGPTGLRGCFLASAPCAQKLAPLSRGAVIATSYRRPGACEALPPGGGGVGVGVAVGAALGAALGALLLGGIAYALYRRSRRGIGRIVPSGSRVWVTV